MTMPRGKVIQTLQEVSNYLSSTNGVETDTWRRWDEGLTAAILLLDAQDLQRGDRIIAVQPGRTFHHREYTNKDQALVVGHDLSGSAYSLAVTFDATPSFVDWVQPEHFRKSGVAQ
jgi:hypothetical protein